jgi:sec-independent protein translocase protein TatC
MTLFEELIIFIKSIFYWICYFIGFSFFFFIFGLKKVVIFGQNYFLPLPTKNSFSVQVFNKIRYDLLPPGVQLVVTNPISAFVSQILLSMLLSFLLTTPLFIYKIIMYLQPALLPREKKVVLWSLLPFAFLFFTGSAFSYFFLIPATFKILYPYATVINAIPFFSIDEFIYYVFVLMIAVGVMFLLPLFMILLSFVGIIKADFWRKNWRYALLFFLVLSAIITPDGTGITMVMLFLPLTALYFAGYVFANKLSRGIVNKKVELVEN